MYWRLRHKDFQAGKGRGNKAAMKRLADRGQPLGVIAYRNGHPVGWCSISPRRQLARLETSRYFRLVDDADVWSITCFYVRPEQRRQGLSANLIREACEYAATRGAGIIESYPIVPSGGRVPDAFAWVGFAPGFEQAGFRQVTRPSRSRSYMRRYLDE
jgi:GNAT superfamily N-acetyltransferase